MSPDDIKKIRSELNLTQEQLASMLGVNKSTVARYETPGNSRPTGENERKLLLLQKFYSDKDERKKILNIKELAGIPGIAALLAAGASLFPVARLAIGGVALATILKLFAVINKEGD